MMSADMDYDDYFKEKYEEIKSKHDELGHKLGSTFLMSPKETLSPKTEIAFITLNPGGGKQEEHVPSCEDGAAYHNEYWGGDKTYSSFQEQIQYLFEKIYENFNDKRRYKNSTYLLNKTLCSQYIPFRSKSYAFLPEKKDTNQFAYTLWSDIFLNCIKPKLVITQSVMTFNAISGIMRSKYSSYTPIKGFEKIDTGWGKVKAKVIVFEDSNNKKCTLMGLPHLSWYKIFSKDFIEKNQKTRNGNRAILDKMTEHF